MALSGAVKRGALNRVRLERVVRPWMRYHDQPFASESDWT